MIIDPGLVGVAVTVCSWVTVNLLPSVQRGYNVALDKNARTDTILMTFF